MEGLKSVALFVIFIEVNISLWYDVGGIVEGSDFRERWGATYLKRNKYSAGAVKFSLWFLEFSYIVQYIKDHTPENAVVFLTGVGKCFPILRSHKVLNNLHQAFVRAPVVMFFQESIMSRN